MGLSDGGTGDVGREDLLQPQICGISYDRWRAAAGNVRRRAPTPQLAGPVIVVEESPHARAHLQRLRHLRRSRPSRGPARASSLVSDIPTRRRSLVNVPRGRSSPPSLPYFPPQHRSLRSHPPFSTPLLHPVSVGAYAVASLLRAPSPVRYEGEWGEKIGERVRGFTAQFTPIPS